MKKSPHIPLIIIICILIHYTEAYAIKANTNIIKYRQPNGSVILLKSYGDEFLGYTKTLDGYLVSKGPDGYLYYSNFNAGYFTLTDQRVNSCSSATKSMENRSMRSSSIAVNTAMALREKSFRKLNQRNLFPNAPKQEENSVKEVAALVLLVQFPNKKFTVSQPKEHFIDMLNRHGYSKDGATGSAADYMNENFGTLYKFTFDVEGLFTMTHPVEHYGNRTDFSNDADIAALVKEACKAAYESGVDFSKYDSDKDGSADNIAIVFAGCNEAESANASLIWPHKGDISSLRIEYNGVKIASYTCSSELGGDETDPHPSGIGIFCHEYLHSWGLPDLYDVNADEEGYAHALYKALSIMDEGYYSNNGKTPPFFTSIEREILNLAPIKEIVADTTYTLQPIQSSDTLYKVPTANEGEYFLLECRNATGWDSNIGGKGLLVYHIDKSKNECGGISAERRWELNIINSYAPHECAKVLAADPYAANTSTEQESIPAANNNSRSALFFPGASHITNLTANGAPRFIDWHNMPFGISITEITYNNGAITFNTHKGISFSDSFPAAYSIATTPYQKSALIEWSAPNSSTNGDDQASGSDGWWHISVTQQDTLLPPIEQKSREPYCVISHLESHRNYKGTIHYALADSIGKTSTFSFTTEKESSPHPYIKLSGRYKKGAVACFNVQNLSEKYTSITYRINGVQLKEPHYKFEDAGEYHIEVIIKYPDSSEDIITKTVIVE